MYVFPWHFLIWFLPRYNFPIFWRNLFGWGNSKWMYSLIATSKMKATDSVLPRSDKDLWRVCRYVYFEHSLSVNLAIHCCFWVPNHPFCILCSIILVIISHSWLNCLSHVIIAQKIKWLPPFRMLRTATRLAIPCLFIFFLGCMFWTILLMFGAFELDVISRHFFMYIFF